MRGFLKNILLFCAGLLLIFVGLNFLQERRSTSSGLSDKALVTERLDVNTILDKELKMVHKTVALKKFLQKAKILSKEQIKYAHKTFKRSSRADIDKQKQLIEDLEIFSNTVEGS